MTADVALDVPLAAGLLVLLTLVLAVSFKAALCPACGGYRTTRRHDTPLGSACVCERCGHRQVHYRDDYRDDCGDN